MTGNIWCSSHLVVHHSIRNLSHLW